MGRPGSAERVVMMSAASGEGTSGAADPLTKYQGSWWHFGILLGLWLAVLLALVFWGVDAREGMQQNTAQVAPSTCPGAAAPGTGKTLATLTATEHANTAIVFRRDLQPRSRALEYDVDD